MAINLLQGKQIATASWAINAISSSYSQTASYAINALTASYLEGYISPFPFTGSAQITGSLGITGSLNVTQGITGSLFGTASWATNSLTASFITGSNVFGPFGSNSTISASFAVSSSRAVTSSFAISSSFATTSSFAISSSFATTSSFAVSSSRAVTSSFAISSSFATTSSFAVSSSYSLSSSFATIAGDASSINASITNNANNYVVTATGTGVINGESNLQFDGTTLNVLGSLQNGDPGNTNGTDSHTEGYRSTTYLAYSHAEGNDTFTGQDGYDVVGMGDGALILDSEYGNVTSSFTGGFILYDDSKYDSTYGFRRLQYTSVVFNGDNTIIFLSDPTITTPSGRATVGIPGVATLDKAKNIVPFSRTANHAEGSLTIADGEASHAEGSGSTSIGDYSHAEGIITQAIGSGSHTEGSNTLAVGNYSHAEGLQTQTINPNSHTEGNSTYTGQYGYQAEYTGTPGVYSLLEKYGDVTAQFTNAYVIVDDTFQDNTVGLKEVELEAVSFAGGQTIITLKEELTTPKLYIGVSGVFAPTYTDKIIPVNKQSSHAEGSGSFALGTGAHAEGYNTRAIGNYSNTKGLGTIAEGEGQVVIGKYNLPTTNLDTTFIVGYGTGENDRRNAMYIKGPDVFIAGNLTVNGNLFATSSWATNSLTSSFITGSNVFGPFGANSILSASYSLSSSFAVTSSFAISSSRAVTSSFASTASFVNSLNQNVIITGSASIGTGSAGPSENTLTLGPPPGGGAGEGGQLGLQATGGSYTSASFLDNWQNQFRVLRGTNNGSNAGLMYMDLQSGNTQFVGAVTASAYSGLPNAWLHALRNSNQTIGSGTWADRDVIFNTYSSNNFTYNISTGIATLSANKTYRITARLAWAAAGSYTLKFRLYNQTTSAFTGPTVELIQSPNSTYNVSDGTLETIFAVGATNIDISVRTTSDTDALSGEYIRGDLNTQLIIQQIA